MTNSLNNYITNKKRHSDNTSHNLVNIYQRINDYIYLIEFKYSRTLIYLYTIQQHLATKLIYYLHWLIGLYKK